MINQEEYEVLKGLDERAKSIVRQERGWLWVAEQPIMKDGWSWFVADGFDEKLKDDNLFQFIQWEDEEPYRVADLIKEYEDKGDVGYALKGFSESLSEFNKKMSTESEEEMKKDKDWLKEEIESKFRRWYDSAQSLNSLVANVNNLINQLDEPEKVVVPKFVAEWIEEAKKEGEKLYHQCGYVIEYAPFSKRKDYLFEHSETFARAWLDGYEVEKEPLFYIPLGVVRSDGNEFYLAKTSLDVIGIDSSSERYVKDKWNAHYYRFTEQEIKDYDERFWAFAAPVEEVEE